MAGVTNELKPSKKKIFYISFKKFVAYLVNYELRINNKASKGFIFFKIFVFWKFFIALWNNLVTSAGLPSFSLFYKKKVRVFFMAMLIAKLSQFEKKKNIFPNLDGHLKYFKRTHLMDLYLFWNLYYYYNVLVRFYSASFLVWAKFLAMTKEGHNEKSFLALKSLYGFSDLYKNVAHYKDLSSIFLYYLNFDNLISYGLFIKKDSLSFLGAQYSHLCKNLDQTGLIFDRAFPDFAGVYASKKKRYTPFFFTVHFEYNAKGFIGHNRRRFFRKKNMLLSI